MAASNCMIQLVRSPAQGPRDRPVTWRQHGLCRGPAPSGITYLHDHAHWPVRLNGRACRLQLNQETYNGTTRNKVVKVLRRQENGNV